MMATPSARDAVDRPDELRPHGGLHAMSEVISNVLLADANLKYTTPVAKYLSHLGHNVDVVTDGEAAMRLLQVQNMDVILLDSELPESGGYEVLGMLQGNVRLRDIPVIVMQDPDDERGGLDYLEAGAEYLLRKPFGKNVLTVHLDRCLAHKHLVDRQKYYTEKIEKSQARVNELLQMIFPGPVAEELKALGEVRPRRYQNVAVMFTDLVGFTTFCDRNEPEVAVAYLQQITKSFEEVCDRYDVQKIKTIGDAFMATSGLLGRSRSSPVLDCVRAGMGMVEAL
jgi:CheY-like chemotaxis protein